MIKTFINGWLTFLWYLHNLPRLPELLDIEEKYQKQTAEFHNLCQRLLEINAKSKPFKSPKTIDVKEWRNVDDDYKREIGKHVPR